MFALNQPDIPGYDPAEVDALMQRVEAQYQQPHRNLITASMVTAAKFSMEPGGYQISAVDNTLAKLADTLEVREIGNRIVHVGKMGVAEDLSVSLREISKVLKAGAKAAFSSERPGYNRNSVKELLGSIAVIRGELVSPDAFEMRTRQLGISGTGFSRREVDLFCNLVASAANKQKALG